MALAHDQAEGAKGGGPSLKPRTEEEGPFREGPRMEERRAGAQPGECVAEDS